MKPRTSLALRDLKNEPWPQSCWMMKMRTRNPAARTARPMVSHQEMDRVKYIATHSSTYGPKESTICQMLRQSVGCAYLATTVFQEVSTARAPLVNTNESVTTRSLSSWVRTKLGSPGLGKSTQGR